MPKPEQIFVKLEGDGYFSTFDAAKGYWQISMSEEAKMYIAFVTHIRGRGVGSNSIQCISCQKWVHKKCSGINGSSNSH